jgi:hypothetical protein
MNDAQPGCLSPPPADPLIDSTVAQAARVYDYLLGGVDHFSVDIQMAETMYGSAAGVDKARKRVRAQRDFLGRAVRYLAREAGIRQFLDLGTGIPNADNVHRVAQATVPDSRVVCVDHDLVVLAHAHLLLLRTSQSATDFIFGDMCDHEGILAKADTTLDLDKPIGLVMVGVLHHFRDDEDPQALVRRYVDAVPSGSYLVLDNIGKESEDLANLGERMENVEGAEFTLVPRDRTEVARFFEGLELIEPGVVPVDHWRPDGPLPDYKTPHPCGVGRKP